MNYPEHWSVPDHVPHERVVDFDYMNPPGAAEDVHLAWKALHAGPDIVWSPYYGGHWIATRGEDIEAMQKDHTHFSHRHVSIPPVSRVQLAPLELDPPEHTAYRNLITPSRLVTEDMEYKGVTLKKGDQIQLPNSLFGLDERKFANPLDVDLTRKPVLHAAFGNGPHRCPGSFLARTEIKVFLQEWLKRIPDFGIREGDKPRCGSGSVNGMLYLPLTWPVAS